ncbi:MAG: PilZ domain-containing protein [Acidobacteria bacterium]|nr:PilZ domain-containing protein [Acidobacteriota bacterium]
MFDEQRVYRRVPASLDVLWNGRLTNNHARVTNVSVGGCYVETAGRVSLGELICIDMMLPLHTHLHLRGQVMHREWPMGFGLRFVNLIDEAQASFLRLVNCSRSHSP